MAVAHLSAPRLSELLGITCFKVSPELKACLQDLLVTPHIVEVVRRPPPSGGAGGRRPNFDRSQWYEPPAPLKATKVVDKTEYTALVGIINKMAPSNKDTVKEKIVAAMVKCGPHDAALIDTLSKAIFTTACRSPVLAPLLAALVADLKNNLLREHMRMSYLTFIDEFKKPFVAINLNNEHLEIEDAEKRKAAVSADYDEFCKQNKEKTRRRGFALWIVELALVGILQAPDVYRVVRQLVFLLEADITKKDHEEQVGEYIKCIAAIFKRVGDKAPQLKAKVKEVLTGILDQPPEKNPGLVSRTRFALMDCVDAL
jgi:hypothetical protein